MTEENAKSIADDVFARFKNENSVFVTADGQAFFDKMHAKNHAFDNRTKKELKIFDFLREGADEKEDEKGAEKDKK